MYKQQIKEIVLLVGGNPLPNYVAAHALGATYETKTVRLMYTPETKEVKNNLLSCLDRRSFEVTCSFIKDAADAAVIREACNNIDPASHLHYTGGTNFMAVHVHAVWKAKTESPGQASYLSGKDDRLVTDDGHVIALNDIPLDLKTLATLHGLENCEEIRKGCDDGPRLPDDANKIAAKAFGNPEWAEELYSVIPYKESDFKKCPFSPHTMDLCLSQPVIPGREWTSKQIDVWRRFLRGEWLEEWVYGKIQKTELIKNSNLFVGVKPQIQKRQFELDVVAIQKHHLYVMSCTTDRKASMCKSKLFEVAMRARQLGGDLARSALVCLADKDGGGNDIVENLQKDITTLSEPSRPPRVFGLHNVLEWMGHAESEPNLTTLKKWLKD